MRCRISLGVIGLLFVASAGRSVAEEVLLSMADPFVITCTNPAKPSLRMGAEGGLDAGQVGDSDFLMLGPKDVGKRFYGTNDAVTIHFRATGEVALELGILLSQYGMEKAQVLVDGVQVGEFGARAKPERQVVHKFTFTGTGQVQALTVKAPLGVGDYVQVDALRLSAGGPISIVNQRGEPVLRVSPALPPAAVEKLLPALKEAPDLARLGPNLSYTATEEFASSADGSRTYTAQAALDGDPEKDYWAGGTPPPHALVLQWRQPVTITTHRLRWMGENRGVWYGLEAWVGDGWKLLYEDPRNLQPEPVYQFAAVTTSRVRFTVYAVTGQQRMLLRAFELYHLPGEARP